MAHHNGEPRSQWIERDQFACYLTVAEMIADPEESPAFRCALGGALVATRYLDRHLDCDTSPDNAPEQHHAMRLLDDIRDRCTPAVTWVGFVLELWTRSRDLRLALER